MSSKKSLVETPQTQPIPGSNQQRNNAGGYSWVVDDIVRLHRFICLGTEGGNYYAKEPVLEAGNAMAIESLILQGRGKEVVKEILEFSLAGRTAKQDPIIFALALCARSKDPETRSAAYAAVGKICRIPTFLFSFVQFVEKIDPQSTGWGRGMRSAISDWYLEKDPKDLAFAVTKYRQRNGWSHKDLLRLCHAKPQDEAHQLVFRYIIKGAEGLENAGAPAQQNENENGKRPAPNKESLKEALEFLQVVEQVSKMVDEKETENLCDLIKRFKLAREHLPTQVLNSVPVWQALLLDMPMTAMLRNLAKMTSIGLLADGNQHTSYVVKRFLDPEQLKKARIHPFNILVALNTYAKGQGEKGSLKWNPLTDIKDALDKAFYLAFKFVEPTGQRVVVGLDVSGSMGCNVMGSDSISCREAAMAMSLVMANTEPECKMMCFTDTFVPLKGVSPKKTLQENLQAISGLPFGATDCSLPMVWARERKVQADVFIVYTDNETYAGKVQPSQALARYRSDMKIPHAKLIVVGMAVNQFTIADPNDRGMMDIAGFDSNAPEVMRNFMLGIF